MPVEPPPTKVNEAFITELSACLWQKDHFLDAAGNGRWPTLVDKEWCLSAYSGHLVSKDTAETLHEAKALEDGTYLDKAEKQWKLLVETSENGNEWAVAVVV